MKCPSPRWPTLATSVVDGVIGAGQDRDEQRPGAWGLTDDWPWNGSARLRSKSAASFPDVFESCFHVFGNTPGGGVNRGRARLQRARCIWASGRDVKAVIRVCGYELIVRGSQDWQFACAVPRHTDRTCEHHSLHTSPASIMSTSAKGSRAAVSHTQLSVLVIGSTFYGAYSTIYESLSPSSAYASPVVLHTLCRPYHCRVPRSTARRTREKIPSIHLVSFCWHRA